MGWADKYKKAQNGADERYQSLKTKDNIPAQYKMQDKPMSEDLAARLQQAALIRETGEITPHEPQGWLDKKVDILTNPVTAFGYAARNQDIPDNFTRGPRNLTDYALDVVNPAQYALDTKNLVQGIATGDMAQIGEGALGVVPLGLEARNISKVGKGLIKNRKAIGRDLLQEMGSTGQFIDETHGFLKNNKANKASVKEGSDWLKNWTSHPATHKRIDEAYNRQRDYKIFSDKDRFKALQLKTEAKSHIPEVGEYPLSTQFTDLLGRNFSPHKGNVGVSYTNALDYNDKGMGSWVSRSSVLPQKMRSSVAVHEGTHDWFKKGILKHSGIDREIRSLYNPVDRQSLELWEQERRFGRKPGGGVGQSVLNKDQAYKAYISNPTEMHARVMELRKRYNIKPDTEITDQLILDIMTDARDWGISGTPELLELIDYNPRKFKNLLKTLPVGAGVAAGTQAANSQMKNGGWAKKYENGGIIEDDRGQWAHPGEVTKINSNDITMEGVDYPVLGISDTGDKQMMMPGENYKFEGKSVTEYPMAQHGKMNLQKKDKTSNFTGQGWLSKYTL